MQLLCFILTTQLIADQVGTEYGKDMKALLLHEKEKIFVEPDLVCTGPEDPNGNPTQAPGDMERYKAKLLIYHKEDKEYDLNKAKLFNEMLGRSQVPVRSRLDNDTGF